MGKTLTRSGQLQGGNNHQFLSTFNGDISASWNNLFKKGADIAVAPALSPGNDGNAFDVTAGTGPITSIDTMGVGSMLLLQFDVIVTVTHHATNLVLPGGTNITTAVGQILVFHEYATGQWRLVSNSVASATSTSTSTTVSAYNREYDDKWAIKGFSIAADRYTIQTPSALQIEVNGKLHEISSVTDFDLSASATWDTTVGTDYTLAANRAGKDFYIYAIDNSGTTLIEISANSTVPDGYTSATSRKIGGFHCLCVAVGTISGHTLTGFVAGDVLPASIWDYDHRPVSTPEGMVFANAGVWVDIYLPSVSGGELVSVYNGTIADGVSTESFHTYKFEQWFARISKKTISQLEFVDASLGSNQSTNITGSADPSTTGGHSDTAGRRMVSDIGCEDMCGAVSQWGRDTGGKTSGIAWANAYDSIDTGIGGQHNEAPYRPLLSGNWSDGAKCGSRYSQWTYSPLIRFANCSSRGVAEPKN